jgi:nucleoside-diphosphate-sugar epimerase
MLMVGTLRLLEKIGLFPPIKAEQILRPNEDMMFDFSKAHDDLGYPPISFEEGIGQEIEAMRLAGLI